MSLKGDEETLWLGLWSSLRSVWCLPKTTVRTSSKYEVIIQSQRSKTSICRDVYLLRWGCDFFQFLKIAQTKTFILKVASTSSYWAKQETQRISLITMSECVWVSVEVGSQFDCKELLNCVLQHVSVVLILEIPHKLKDNQRIRCSLSMKEENEEIIPSHMSSSCSDAIWKQRSYRWQNKNKKNTLTVFFCWSSVQVKREG